MHHRLGKSPLPMSPALLSCPIKFPWDPTAQEKNGKVRGYKEYTDELEARRVFPFVTLLVNPNRAR